MFRFYTFLFTLSALVFTKPFPDESNDLTIDTATFNSDDPTVDTIPFNAPLSTNNPDVLAEAIPPQTKCASDASSDASDANTVLKRNAAMCRPSSSPEGQKPDDVTAEPNVDPRRSRPRKTWRARRPPKVLPEVESEDGNWNHPYRPYMTHDHTCDDHELQPEHVTCAGAEYGTVFLHDIKYVLNCARGSWTQAQMPRRPEFPRAKFLAAEYCCAKFGDDDVLYMAYFCSKLDNVRMPTMSKKAFQNLLERMMQKYNGRGVPHPILDP